MKIREKWGVVKVWLLLLWQSVKCGPELLGNQVKTEEHDTVTSSR